MRDITVPYEQLLQLCADRLAREQLPPEQAATVAEVLVHADLRGVESHGVSRTEHYVRRLRAGGINPTPNIRTTGTGPCTAVVDGDDGFGHVVAKKAMDAAIELAGSGGIGMISVVNSSHCGALSYYVGQAARHGMIGMMMANTDKFIVPFGAAEPFFGTNPVAYGFPARSAEPIIFDMATSQVAMGKVFRARQQGAAIPPDWGVDAAGSPTTDPHRLTALFPFGRQKGSGLAMVVDIFAGILTGSAFGPHVSPMYEEYDRKRKLGHFLMAIDIGRFTNRETFMRDMDHLVGELHGLRPADGFDSVLVPGEPEQMKERARRLRGIPVPESVYRFLHSHSNDMGEA